jgi:hypothetical protein
MDIELENIPSEVADAKSSVALYRIVSYPADFTLRVLYEKWNDGELILPRFQRKFVWSATQASRLIESFLMGLPVPEIFLYRDPSQRQIIIDGHQRLKSVFSFFNGDLPDGRPFYLRGVNEEWAGKTWEELGDADKRRLRDSVLRSILVEQVDPEDVTSIYHVFERLNTGGTSLTPQEVRNCVFHGPFNDLLVDLNKDARWRNIMGTPDADKRMRDIELIARFFALADGHRGYTKPMKDFISAFMKKYQPSENNSRFIALFRDTVDAVLQHLGPKPFHVKRGLNAAVFDSVMVAFASANNIVPSDAKTRYRRLIEDKKYVKTTTAGTTDETSVATRIRRAQRILFRQR